MGDLPGGRGAPIDIAKTVLDGGRKVQAIKRREHGGADAWDPSTEDLRGTSLGRDASRSARARATGTFIDQVARHACKGMVRNPTCCAWNSSKANGDSLGYL